MIPGETVIGIDQGNHLWVVLSKPTADGDIAIVNFSEHRGADCGQSPCTVIQPGEHPYITKETCVFYRRAMLTSMAGLDEACERGVFRRHSALTAELLERIQRDAVGHRKVDRIVRIAIQASLPRKYID